MFIDRISCNYIVLWFIINLLPPSVPPRLTLSRPLLAHCDLQRLAFLCASTEFYMNINQRLQHEAHVASHNATNRTLIVSEWWFNETNVACCEWNQFCECAAWQQKRSKRNLQPATWWKHLVHRHSAVQQSISPGCNSSRACSAPLLYSALLCSAGCRNELMNQCNVDWAPASLINQRKRDLINSSWVT